MLLPAPPPYHSAMMVSPQDTHTTSTRRREDYGSPQNPGATDTWQHILQIPSIVGSTKWEAFSLWPGAGMYVHA